MLTRIAIASILIGLIVISHAVAYEIEHNSPWGRMCNSAFTGFIDTCR